MRRVPLIVLLAVYACTRGERTPPSARFAKPPAPTPTVLAAGDSLYVRHCQPCHGVNGLGSDRGPPLVHSVYAPGHHSDQAFILAVRNGVRAHHWTFGDMPAQPGVSDNDISNITSYVRWLQAEAGIH